LRNIGLSCSAVRGRERGDLTTASDTPEENTAPLRACPTAGSPCLAILIVQAVAAAYFVIDGVDDLLTQVAQGIDIEVVMECLVAVALLAGVVTGARYVRTIHQELRRKDQSFAKAKGALAEHIALRFAEWNLSPGESDVALFTLKGLEIAEIATLRNAATGTVRSQLSQVYAKAGVSSQAMLVALFIEDLMASDAPQ
jgi:DNA-binding NarL/FixJ family response regulator